MADTHQQQTQKLPIMRIQTKKARNLSYKVRKNCLMKKSMELSTLCDIRVCAIVFGPDGVLETWPQNSSAVKNIISKFHCEKMGRIAKEIDIAKRRRCFEKVKQPRECHDFISKLSGEEAIDLVKCLDSKLKEASDRAEFLKGMSALKKLKGKEVAGFNGEARTEMNVINVPGMVNHFCENQLGDLTYTTSPTHDPRITNKQPLGYDFYQSWQIFEPNNSQTLHDFQPLKALAPVTSNWPMAFYNTDFGSTIKSSSWPLMEQYRDIEGNRGCYNGGFNSPSYGSIPDQTQFDVIHGNNGLYFHGPDLNVMNNDPGLANEWYQNLQILEPNKFVTVYEFQPLEIVEPNNFEMAQQFQPLKSLPSVTNSWPTEFYTDITRTGMQGFSPLGCYGDNIVGIGGAASWPMQCYGDIASNSGLSGDIGGSNSTSIGSVSNHNTQFVDFDLCGDNNVICFPGPDSFFQPSSP